MGAMTHAAGRMAFSAAIDVALKDVRKNREEGIVKLVDLMEKYMSDEKMDVNYDTVRNMIRDKDCTLNKYMNRIIDEIDPHVLKTTALNLGYEAFFYGTKTIRKMREVHQCNVPWLILMDPTSACNLHCTGCWAAEYGNRLNLTFEEMDNVITQGKELGIYFYMFTGGEPLVRKADIIKLCEKHNDCAFLAYTNGTLVDEAFCEQMQKVGNLYLAISLEGFAEVNDLRRGNGVFGKVMNAMSLLKQHGLIFGTSICYTSKNIETVTSDEFVDLLVENGSRYALYFHYMPVGAQNSPYKELFRRVNRLLEQHKFHRYTAEDLRLLNDTAAYPDGRECKVCGTSAALSGELCPWCRLFAEFSYKIQHKSVLVVSRQPSAADDCTLPTLDGSGAYLTTTDRAAAQKRLASGEPILRIYTKNTPYSDLSSTTNLYVGDYAASNSMEELAQQSAGVRRIAVCRMDVDNLGHAFISGFEQENEKDPVRRMRYVNLSRTSAFSRQMSLFFKGYINGILEGLQVSIVYAGGDDVFLVGAWSDVLEAAQRIQRNLTAFSCGALTLSAGIGIFDDHYPIRLSAEETAALEEAAKHLPGKNAVALFMPERKAVRDAKGNLLVQPEQGHTYAWDTFRTAVLEEKVGCLQRFFQAYDSSCADKGETPRGNSMLYNLLALLREAENDRINLARYAYLLARLSPKKSAPDYPLYEQFSHSMMDWALDAVQRHQLITAIYIYVYQNRKGGDTDGRME